MTLLGHWNLTTASLTDEKKGSRPTHKHIPLELYIDREGFNNYCHNPNSTSTQLKSWVWHVNDFNPPTTQTQCQQYLSCFWPDFILTLKLGSLDEQQQQQQKQQPLQQHLQQH